MIDTIRIHPIGMIQKRDAERPKVVIFEPYRDALLGIEGFSHIHVLFWFHENDSPEGRSVLQVNPRKDPRNPLTGVFATHSPLRPNLIGLTRSRIVSVDGLVIELEEIDARDGSPVLDIKCFIPDREALTDLKLPEWV